MKDRLKSIVQEIGQGMSQGPLYQMMSTMALSWVDRLPEQDIPYFCQTARDYIDFIEYGEGKVDAESNNTAG